MRPADRLALSALGFTALAFAPPALAMEPAGMTYLCDRGVEVPAVYVNHPGEDGIAVIHVEGRLITLIVERSASGARYGWPSDGSHYVWWTKGDEATLYWHDGATGDETPVLTGCKTS